MKIYIVVPYYPQKIGARTPADTKFEDAQVQYIKCHSTVVSLYLPVLHPCICGGLIVLESCIMELILLNSYITSMGHAPAACEYEWSNTDIKAQLSQVMAPTCTIITIQPVSVSKLSLAIFLGAPGMYHIWGELPFSCSSPLILLLWYPIAYKLAKEGTSPGHRQPASSSRCLLHCLGTVHEFPNLQKLLGAVQCFDSSGSTAFLGSLCLQSKQEECSSPQPPAYFTWYFRSWSNSA